MGTARQSTDQPPARTKDAPKPSRKPSRAQVTSRGDRLAFSVDDRPPLSALDLPGPRREREGRGGAHSRLGVLRYLIRCPLLPALSAAIAPRRNGRPPAYPDLFWVFFTVAIREFASIEQLNQELHAHWEAIAKEFYFEHGISLPRKRGVAYASFNSWRTNVLDDRYNQLDIVLDRFTAVSAPLAMAIRSAEGGEQPRDLLSPGVWDCIAADGTVRTAPSDVRGVTITGEDGDPTLRYPGSRARPDHPESARVHEPMQKVDKRSGSSDGLYSVAATTKGKDRYTRTVLSVDMGTLSEGETAVAMRALHRAYQTTGNTLPVLVYDGGITPVNWQDLMAQHGIFVVNPNYARSRRRSGGAAESAAESFPTDSDVTGEGVHKFGHKRGQRKRTYVTPLPDVECTNGGVQHVHHLPADDGAVYELDRPALKGGNSRRLAPLLASTLERHRDSGGAFYFVLHLRGSCRHGGTFGYTAELRHTEPNNGGHIGWREHIANIRIIPEISPDYPEVMGQRNQVESFFGWMEKCYYRHDRAASWGRDPQLWDLVGAALLHNAEAWAHLAYRHPKHADELQQVLSNLPEPDLSTVTRKPEEERKKARQAALRQPEFWATAYATPSAPSTPKKSHAESNSEATTRTRRATVPSASGPTMRAPVTPRRARQLTT